MEKILEEAADLLWRCRDYAQTCGLGEAGKIMMLIEEFIHKHFVYDLVERRFKLKIPEKEKK